MWVDVMISYLYHISHIILYHIMTIINNNHWQKSDDENLTGCGIYDKILKHIRMSIALMPRY